MTRNRCEILPSKTQSIDQVCNSDAPDDGPGRGIGCTGDDVERCHKQFSLLIATN
jgi:hypothetical protein